jgi:hypothetical protein
VSQGKDSLVADLGGPIALWMPTEHAVRSDAVSSVCNLRELYTKEFVDADTVECPVHCNCDRDTVESVQSSPVTTTAAMHWS